MWQCTCDFDQIISPLIQWTATVLKFLEVAKHQCFLRTLQLLSQYTQNSLYMWTATTSKWQKLSIIQFVRRANQITSLGLVVKESSLERKILVYGLAMVSYHCLYLSKQFRAFCATLEIKLFNLRFDKISLIPDSLSDFLIRVIFTCSRIVFFVSTQFSVHFECPLITRFWDELCNNDVVQCSKCGSF